MKGVIAYYAFLMLFIVSFVAVVGVFSQPSITGNAVVPLSVPEMHTSEEIQQEVAVHIGELPQPSRRVFIVARPEVQENSLYSLVKPRHFFPSGFSADATQRQLAVIAQRATVTDVPIYHIAGRSLPSTQVPKGISLLSNGQPDGGEGVMVAVLDTGIAPHPDLIQRIVSCKDFTDGPQVHSTCVDGNGHGTHMAGIIAADGGNDGKGIYGMAPKVKLAIAKVCSDDGNCYGDDLAAAISATDANILSISLTGPADGLLQGAISRAAAEGKLLIAAGKEYPAAYHGVIGVSAGAAPSDSVESTWLDGRYYTISGDSPATAHIAGLAATLWQGDAAQTRAVLP